MIGFGDWTMTTTIKSVATLAIASCLLWPASGFSFDGTGADLLRVCSQAKGTPDFRLCAAYVGGVYDGMFASQLFLAIGRKTCLPRSLPDDDIIAIVRKYMRATSSANDPIASIVGATLAAEFPCKE